MNDRQVEALADELREFTALKYVGDCKCGKCQLVPREVLDRTIKALRSRTPSAPDVAMREVLESKIALAVNDELCRQIDAKEPTDSLNVTSKIVALSCIQDLIALSASEAKAWEPGQQQREKALAVAQQLVDLFVWEPSDETGKTEPHLNSVWPDFNDVLTDLKNELRWIDVLPEESATPTPAVDREAVAQTRSRFVWDVVKSEWGYEYDRDQICTDRLTGRIVVRYDLGDPANYSSAYGGPSQDEYLERKGFDPRERIPLASDDVTLKATAVTQAIRQLQDGAFVLSDADAACAILSLLAPTAPAQEGEADPLHDCRNPNVLREKRGWQP